MANYQEMYLELFRATTRAIDILVEAQQKCEELYISAEDNLILLPKEEDKEK